MHCGTAGQAGVPGEQLVAGVKTFIRERGPKANIWNYYTRVTDPLLLLRKVDGCAMLS
jgi:hypothetical protein